MAFRAKVTVRLTRDEGGRVRAFVIASGGTPVPILERARGRSVDVMKQRVTELYADHTKYDLVWEDQCTSAK